MKKIKIIDIVDLYLPRTKADYVELAVMEYENSLVYSIVRKGIYKTGDRVFFIPVNTYLNNNPLTKHLNKSSADFFTLFQKRTLFKDINNIYIKSDGVVLSINKINMLLNIEFPGRKLDEKFIIHYLKTGKELKIKKYEYIKNKIRTFFRFSK